MSTEISMPAGKQISIAEDEKSAAVETPPLSDFIMIAEQNLFHPDRKLLAQKASVPPPEIILYGVLITDTLSIAFIEDNKAPRSTPGRGKRQIQLKKGDAISGYVLRDVEPDRIILVKGDEKLVALLDDKSKRNNAKPTATMALKKPTGTLTSSLPAASPVVTQPSISIPSAVSPAVTVYPKATTSFAPSQIDGGQALDQRTMMRRRKIQRLPNEN
jgi:hypothetical protein